MSIQEPNLGIEQVFLNLPCSLWWMDREHNFIGCNIETCAGLRAHSPVEILGKTLLEIAEANDLLEFRAKIIHEFDEHIMETGVTELQIKNMVPPHFVEEPFHQLGAKKPIFNKKGKVIGLMGVALFDRDINKEFKESLQQLELNQFRLLNHPIVNLEFKEIFQLMPASLFWMDREHHYLGGNLECCNIAQVDSQGKFIGKTIHEIGAMNNWPQAKGKNFGDLDEFIMRTGIPEFGIEAIIPRGNQPSILQWCAKKPILNNNQEIIGLMGAGLYNGQFGF